MKLSTVMTRKVTLSLTNSTILSTVLGCEINVTGSKGAAMVAVCLGSARAGIGHSSQSK